MSLSAELRAVIESDDGSVKEIPEEIYENILYILDNSENFRSIKESLPALLELEREAEDAGLPYEEYIGSYEVIIRAHAVTNAIRNAFSSFAMKILQYCSLEPIDYIAIATDNLLHNNKSELAFHLGPCIPKNMNMDRIISEITRTIRNNGYPLM